MLKEAAEILGEMKYFKDVQEYQGQVRKLISDFLSEIEKAKDTIKLRKKQIKNLRADIGGKEKEEKTDFQEKENL
ncbi:MAG: hypothetical protein LHV68_09970 [Elusimicrobia bacterium]|nr:hypothetical protein [Candidatus Liberimonas magnetica]